MEYNMRKQQEGERKQQEGERKGIRFVVFDNY